ncbi:hypothetical protein [Gordonia rhizosphera]|uniref:Tetratricopeptide repeat protein n=1 Tax=Gordonia rhizosphera NBRC 16068 TaxID=1108045 RepID=K6V857_9ACTN|nr:hypothetical protein [Gordonia rhizosphera]GAB92388.1 hypothetical protein GORHZ_172_00060 [Gordonia rhizosphera NBRC 16068]
MTTWDAITAAVGISLGGERERGREELLACWSAAGDSDAGQRCVIAHYLADLQSELDDEVMWDERALDAYSRVRGPELAPVGIDDARGMAPSLHLNLGDGYLRQGKTGSAREHAAAGLAMADALPDDGYGKLIRDGLDRLSTRIAQTDGR